MSLELLVGVQVPVSGGGEGGEEQSTVSALFSSCHCLPGSAGTATAPIEFKSLKC